MHECARDVMSSRWVVPALRHLKKLSESFPSDVYTSPIKYRFSVLQVCTNKTTKEVILLLLLLLLLLPSFLLSLFFRLHFPIFFVHWHTCICIFSPNIFSGFAISTSLCAPLDASDDRNACAICSRFPLHF